MINFRLLLLSYLSIIIDSLLIGIVCHSTFKWLDFSAHEHIHATSIIDSCSIEIVCHGQVMHAQINYLFQVISLLIFVRSWMVCVLDV